MEYRVRVMPEARDEIYGWGLGRENLLRVFNFLQHDLAANPDAFLKERIPPRDLFACNFTLGSPSRRIFCMFAVQRVDDIGELRVVGGNCMDELDREN